MTNFEVDVVKGKRKTNNEMDISDDGPVGSNHGNLQNTPLLALSYRALRELPRCTVRG